jgi:Ca-activated chloride channel family protein
MIRRAVRMSRTAMPAPGGCMKFHTYTKYNPEMADAVDLQALLDGLSDFLLQSGFAEQPGYNPYWGSNEDPADRSMDALKEAILNALIESGQFTPEMLEALRGDGDEDSQQKLSDLLDKIVQRLIADGFINTELPPQMADSHQPVTGKGGLAHAASKDVQFNLSQ